MKKRSKNYQNWNKSVDIKPHYTLVEALEILTANKQTRFDASINLVFHLNLNPKKVEHLLKGFFTLPYPQIKSYKMCVFTENFFDQVEKHQLFLVGGKDLVEQLAKSKKINFDLVLATPEMMTHLNKIGKMLGTKKLMPSNKGGTLSLHLDEMIRAWKQGRRTYQIDSYGNLHLTIGKSSDTPENLMNNFNFCLSYILQIKPSGVKGKYIKGIHLSSSMSPSLRVNLHI